MKTFLTRLSENAVDLSFNYRGRAVAALFAHIFSQ
jgi:hypothetical protein